MPERRDLRPEEMTVILELAMAAPDLVAAKPKLLAALTRPAATGGPAANAGNAGLQPASWKELMEAVRLGVLSPKEAARFVAIPQADPSVLRRLSHLRWQRGGAMP